MTILISTEPAGIALKP